MKFSRSGMFAIIGLLSFAAPWPTGAAESLSIRMSGYSFDPLVDPLPDPAVCQPLAGGELPYIVQCRGAIHESWKTAIRETGGSIKGYIPDAAFLVLMTPSARERVQHLDFVRWLGNFAPSFKIDPAFRDGYNGDWEHMLVRFLGDAAPHAAISSLQAEGMEVLDLRSIGDDLLVVTWLDRELARHLAERTEVLWIEPERPVRLLNDATTWVVQTNITNNRAVWDHGIHGENQIIGILDSGLDYGSCFFRDPQHGQPGPAHRKVIAYRAYGGNLFDTCIIGHGTHTSGTLAGNDYSGVNSLYNGVANGARLTFGDIQGSGLADCLTGMLTITSSLADIFNDCYNDGARVHSNSWGSTENTYDTMAWDVDNFMWNHPDFQVCFANGNSGPNASTVGTPATAKDCLGVGATNRPPTQATLASFSSRGPTADGRMKPNICAPGTNVTSAKNTPGDAIVNSCETVGFGMSGTSMACPAIAGSVTLIRQYFVDGYYPSGAANAGNSMNPSSALLRAVTMNSGNMLNTGNRPGNDQGWGMILLDDALYFTGDQRKLWAIDDSAGLTTGDEDVYELEVALPGAGFRVTLAWTDPAAIQGAQIQLVNDLDLQVENNGSTYVGNHFQNGFSTPGGMTDHLNPSESVFIASAQPGTYTVHVIGFNVPSGLLGHQPYALVATGLLETGPQPSPTATRTPAPTGTPVRTSTPASSGTPSPTPTPAASGTPDRTPTPAPSGSPAPTRTAPPGSPTATPTIGNSPTPPPDFTVELHINQTQFRGGDEFLLESLVYNPGMTRILQHYIVLDLGFLTDPQYYFWPSWSAAPDSLRRTVQSGHTYQDVILDFTVPTDISPAGPFTFWAGMLDPISMDLVGEIDRADFKFM